MKRASIFILTVLAGSILLYGQTPEQIMDRIQIVKQELQDSLVSVNQKQIDICKTYPLPEQKSEFETLAEYQTRLLSGYFLPVMQKWPVFPQVDSLSLAEVNTRLAQVRSTTFLTDSLKVTPVKYDAEKELWKMSVQHLQYKRENIQFDINIPRDKARSLSEAWDRVIIKGQLAFDFNDDVGLIRVIIINPDTKEVFAHNLETYKRLWDAAVIPNSKWFAVSPNAKYLLSEGTQNLNDYLAVRDLGSLNILGSQGIGFTFRNATISADNKFLAVSRSNDYSALEIYSLPSAKEYLTLKGSSMNAVVFSPDSRFIIYGTAEYVNQTGGYRKLVMITDIYSKVSTELYNPEDYVSSLALSPDAKHLIIGLDDRVGYSELLIMELKSLEIVKRYKLSGVTGIYFSPDGTKMGLTYKELFGSSYARIIDLVTYETVGTIPVGIYHKFAFSPDSKYAVTIQNRVLIYDIQTEKLVYASTSSPSFNETRFYPDKRYVLLGPWIDRTYLDIPIPDVNEMMGNDPGSEPESGPGE